MQPTQPNHHYAPHTGQPMPSAEDLVDEVNMEEQTSTQQFRQAPPNYPPPPRYPGQGSAESGPQYREEPRLNPQYKVPMIPARTAAVEVHKHLRSAKTQGTLAITGFFAVVLGSVMGRMVAAILAVGFTFAVAFFLWKTNGEMKRLELKYHFSFGGAKAASGRMDPLR